ncbi:hypothetical protein F3Y22_tig00110676pilonHSYRG00146 [Hibiscus syriacus]|uniref:Uncharacterized protein n=1 Tax=Hibiscus syriacus TaxID=106335 RepID=A0A6A2ZVZ4_HIBSY|nr:hypothetical protein F3Y22_tig00110676pilonHSYRG00146 [Hibiscus syriacus]
MANTADDNALNSVISASVVSSRLFSTKKINVTLDDQNYLLWHQQVFLTIKTHRLQKYIDSNISWPTQYVTRDGVVSLNPEYELYEEQDGALASWLLSTVSEEVLPHLIGLDTTAEIWNTLHRLYSGKTTSRLMSYRRMLHSQRKGDMSMRDYLMKIKSVCDNLASCGEIISEHEHITAILNGLPPEFESVITIITAAPTPPDLRSVSTILLDADIRQSQSFNHVTSCAHVATQATNDQVTANNTSHAEYQYKGEFVDNTGQNFNNSNSSNRGRGRGRVSSSRPQCQLCGRMGHLVERCYYRFDMNYKNESSRPTQNTNTKVYSNIQANVSSYGPSNDNFNSYNPVYYTRSAPQIPQFFAPPFSAPQIHQFSTPQFSAASQAPQVSGFRSQNSPVNIQQQICLNPHNMSSFPTENSNQFTAVTQPQITTQAYIATPETVDDNAWYPDSGATHHITKDLNNLQIRDTHPGTGSVIVGNGNSLPIQCTSQSHFCVNSNKFHLNKLLYVPNITKNLLSVSKFTQDNQVLLEFYPNFCQVRDLQSRKVLLKGSQDGGLYKLNIAMNNTDNACMTTGDKLHINNADNNSLSSINCYIVNTRVLVDVWHKRLGHPFKEVLLSALKHYNITSSDINKEQILCKACQLAKSHKLPFYESLTMYEQPLELIVSDVWVLLLCILMGLGFMLPLLMLTVGILGFIS